MVRQKFTVYMMNFVITIVLGILINVVPFHMISSINRYDKSSYRQYPFFTGNRKLIK